MPARPADRLIAHYRRTARVLSWRSPPGGPAPDPYRVWLSEVMLQQTTVTTVAPRFERFVARWPTVEALAAASDADILGEWAGLGYYARARNLIACARTVAARGGFPDTEDELRALPGIGAYTAAAIAAIAFGRRAVVVDTNVERVVARLTATADRAAIRAQVDALTPDRHAGDFAQALMDLGATICRPRNPNCPACPLAPDCAARALGRPEDFPAPRRKTERPHRHGLAQWIERDRALWLVRRPARGMLGGMAALPGPEWTDARPALPIPPLAQVSWGFSHFTLDLAIVASNERPNDGWWQPLATIAEAGLPSLYGRAVEAVLAARARDAA